MNIIPRWLTITIASTLTLLIIVVIISQGLLAWSRFGQVSNTRTITITAEGKVTAAPDTAEINASIVSNGATAQATQADMDQKAAQLLAYLEKSGVAQSDISTSQYNLSPQYNDNSQAIPVSSASATNQIGGYSATETLTAKIHDLKNIGDVIAGITQNGANQIDSVNYSIDNPNNLQEQAREQALSNAAQKAQALAKAAHVRLGALITFSEQNSSTPPIFPEAMSVGATEGAIASPPVASVPSGTQDITEDVSVTYALK